MSWQSLCSFKMDFSSRLSGTRRTYTVRRFVSLLRVTFVAVLWGGLWGIFVGCEGCHSTVQPGGVQAGSDRTASNEPTAPTMRLYLVSDVAGALEPCGCV